MKNLLRAFILCVILIYTGCQTLAMGDFIKLNIPPISSKPILLNNNELIFLSGVEDYPKKQDFTAKIYNISKDTLFDTEVAMNIPRYQYGAIKFSDNHILLFGGYCKESKDCSNKAEIYDIKNNKFFNIDNTTLNYRFNNNAALLPNGNVIIISGNNIEIFNTKNLKFEKTVKINTPRLFDSNILVLNEEEVLIYGIDTSKDKFIMEIYNITTNKTSSVNIPKDFIPYGFHGSPVLIESNVILFIGLGQDRRDVIKFDNYDKSFSYYNKLPSALAGSAILLDNDNILFSHGCIKANDFWFNTYLEHAIYNHKTNKIKNKKTTKFMLGKTDLIKIGREVFIISGNNYPATMYKQN